VFYAVLVALIALGAMLGAVGCGGASCPTTTNPELRVLEVKDQYGVVHDLNTVDLTRLPVGWKVKLAVIGGGCDSGSYVIKASAYDAKATMTHGSFPTNPTVGDEFYLNGRWYGYCRGYYGTYGWAPRLPGACSVTADGAGAAWVTFAATSDSKAMSVVVVTTLNIKTIGEPYVIGVDPDAKPTLSFPAVTTIVVGQIYVMNVEGNLSWRLPSQGIALYTTWSGKSVLVGTLTQNGNGLTVVFNQNMGDIIASIPSGESRTLTITFTWDGSTYSFPVTVVGTGGTTDTTGPQVVVSGISNGQTVSGTVPVHVSASDPSGIAGIILYIDGVQYGSGGSSPWTWSWNTAGFTDGQHTVTVRVTDGASNVTVMTYTVTVSNSGGIIVPIE